MYVYKVCWCKIVIYTKFVGEVEPYDSLKYHSKLVGLSTPSSLYIYVFLFNFIPVPVVFSSIF